jgi:pyruvate formate lyase activating enzyme
MRPEFNRVVCLGCEEKSCVEACRGGALRKTGESVTAAELLERVKPFEPFFKASGGGVTLSGGEPLAQPRFAREFLALCNKHNIRCGLETCGCFHWEAASDFIRGFDFIYFDVKCTDDKNHQKLTGKSLKTIHANLRKLSRTYPGDLIVSVPVIPGINDNEEEMSRVAALCLENNIRKVRLLPYHDLARPKYEALGIPYNMEGTVPPSERSMELLSAILSGRGLCLVSS